MFFNRIWSRIREAFSRRRPQENAWPETELIAEETTKFVAARKEYIQLMQSLAFDSNPKRQDLSQKYHTEAYQLIYIGFFHIDDFHDMREVRRALEEIIHRIESEAAHIE